MLKIYLFLSFQISSLLIEASPKSIYLFNIISSLIDENNKKRENFTRVLPLWEPLTK